MRFSGFAGPNISSPRVRSDQDGSAFWYPSGTPDGENEYAYSYVRRPRHRRARNPAEGQGGVFR
jgi:integrase